MTTPVTTASFLARFPVFTGQEAQIEALISEVSPKIDDSWDDDDRAPAIMYLVAHMIVTEETADSLAVTSEQLGPISVSYAAPQQPNDPLSLTEYGRRFLALRKQNFTGPVVI